MKTLLIGLSMVLLASCASSSALPPPELSFHKSCIEAKARLKLMYRYNNVTSGATKSYLRVVQSSLDTLCGDFSNLMVGFEEAEDAVKLLTIDLIEEEMKILAIIENMRMKDGPFRVK